MKLEQKAKEFARIIHAGQLRKDGETPYLIHLEETANLLEKIGISNEDIKCSARLHDSMEDCGFSKEVIEKEFNGNIARIVQALTRDVSREEYNERIKNSDYSVQIIKLADTVHNCATLSKNLLEKTKIQQIEDIDQVVDVRGISFN